VGPDRASWRVLDPDDKYEQEWNRGAAYVRFSWAPPGTPTRVEVPAGDFIVVWVDPCDDALDQFHVERVLSTSPLNRGCLRPIGTLVFGDQTRYIYAREDS
jgi:hypothetical protein